MGFTGFYLTYVKFLEGVAKFLWIIFVFFFSGTSGRLFDGSGSSAGRSADAVPGRFGSTVDSLGHIHRNSGISRPFFGCFTGFYWVFLIFFWFLLGLTGFRWLLLGLTGFFWVSLGFTGFYWILLGFTGFYWVSMSSAGFPCDLLCLFIF